MQNSHNERLESAYGVCVYVYHCVYGVCVCVLNGEGSKMFSSTTLAV